MGSCINSYSLYMKHTGIEKDSTCSGRAEYAAKQRTNVLNKAFEIIRIQSEALKDELEYEIHEKLQLKLRKHANILDQLKNGVQKIQEDNEQVYDDADELLTEIDASMCGLRAIACELVSMNSENDQMRDNCIKLKDVIDTTVTTITTSMYDLNKSTTKRGYSAHSISREVDRLANEINSHQTMIECKMHDNKKTLIKDVGELNQKILSAIEMSKSKQSTCNIS